MPRVIFDHEFRFSADGHTVVTYSPGPDAVEVSDRCAEVAFAVGAAREADAATPTPEPAPQPLASPRRKTKEKPDAS